VLASANFCPEETDENRNFAWLYPFPSLADDSLTQKETLSVCVFAPKGDHSLLPSFLTAFIMMYAAAAAGMMYPTAAEPPHHQHQHHMSGPHGGVSGPGGPPHVAAAAAAQRMMSAAAAAGIKHPPPPLSSPPPHSSSSPLSAGCFSPAPHQGPQQPPSGGRYSPNYRAPDQLRDPMRRCMTNPPVSLCIVLIASSSSFRYGKNLFFPLSLPLDARHLVKVERAAHVLVLVECSPASAPICRAVAPANHFPSEANFGGKDFF